MEKKQQAQKSAHDNKQSERCFKVSDTVLVRNFQKGEKWLPGKVEKVLGPRSYLVKLNLGKTVRRHLDHIRARTEATEPQLTEVLIPPMVPPSDPSPDPPIVEVPSIPPPQDPPEPTPPTVRRSIRQSKPPTRYSPKQF